MFPSGTLGCLLLGVASLVFLFGAEWVVFFFATLSYVVFISVTYFVKGFPLHLVLVRPFGLY